MTQTKLAKAPWPKVPTPRPRNYTQTPSKRLDEKFEQWAKREGVNLKDIKLMEKL